MELDLVFNVDVHEVCQETGFCKRCGVHIAMAEEMNYACSFSTNSTAISHLRAIAIADEKMREANRKTLEYIEKVRSRLDSREQEFIDALEGWDDDGR